MLRYPSSGPVFNTGAMGRIQINLRKMLFLKRLIGISRFMVEVLNDQNLLTLKALGFFSLYSSGGGDVFHSLCKIRYRHPRKSKLTGLIAYIMFHKISNLKPQQ